MSVFAISDLHLSTLEPKEMDIFGDKWIGHFDKIRQSWLETVSEDDIILIPGDLSWAMHTEDAIPDIDALCKLPGTKILLKGNHDYWWSSPSRIRAFLHNRTYIIQNDYVTAGDFVFGGTRGWILPTDKNFSQSDKSVYEREKIRLRLSLDAALKCAGDRELIAMMHFPPVNPSMDESEFTQILASYPIRHVVFGHIHNASSSPLLEFSQNGVNYHLVSCDALDFKLKKIL